MTTGSKWTSCFWSSGRALRKSEQPDTHTKIHSQRMHTLEIKTLDPSIHVQKASLELWAVPPQGTPRSLGLISSNGVTVVAREKLPRQVLQQANTSALAVSIEPPGGSPTGAPTGPVVFAGKLTL